jgi:hypothetical protein
MNKKKLAKRLRYLITVLFGIIIFISLIPNCTILSAKSDSLVKVSKNQQQVDISQRKSFENIVKNLPSAKEIRSMSIAPHPRLLASEERFTEIKQQIEIDATMKKWYKKLQQQGEEFLKDELPAYKMLDGKRLFKQNKGLLRRISTLALLYKLDKKPAYFDRLWQELKATVDFPDWNPSHFLDTARITDIFAISYDWLYEDWSDEQRKILRSAIVDKGLKPALSAYQKDKWWVDAKQNWNQVCNGGIGIGALAIIEEYPEIASKVLYQTLKGISSAMQHYAPDGAWDEGTSYWNFGTRYNTLLLAALQTAFDTDFNLSNIPGFSNTGFFPIYMSGSSGLTFNFSDGKEDPVKAPQLFWLSNRFGEPAYTDYQRQIASPEPLDLIWYIPNQDQKRRSMKELPLNKYFRRAEIVSMRSAWENSESIFVGFKAGNNNSSHGNLDIGTFVIDALGVRWAIELGYDEYNLPGYFDKKEERWTYYRMRAEGQNTMVINPDEHPDQNPNAKARITQFEFKPNKSYAVADLTSAYYPKVKHLYRGISLQRKPEQIIIRDEIKTEIPVDLWWFMHTKADIKIIEDGNSAILQQADKRLLIKLLNQRSNYKFTTTNANPLPSSPNPKGQNTNKGINKLVVKLRRVNNERLSVLFVPLAKD